MWFTVSQKEAVELLMSAYEIARREGKDTNWKAFETDLYTMLRDTHPTNIALRSYKVPKL